jgi:serine protease Do
VALALALALAVSAVGAQDEVVPEPEENGPAWLGVWLSDAVDGGVQVLAVVDGGPADQAGLLAGDIVIEAGEDAVGSEAELGRILRSKTPGQKIALRVLRASERLEMTVALGQRGRRATAWTVLPRVPKPAEVRAPRPPVETYRAYVYPDLWNPESAGLQVTEITPALRVHYGAPEETGVLVTKVEPGQPAAVAGLEVGDILIDIGGRPIRSEREVRGNLVRWNSQEPLQVQVIRASAVVNIIVTPSIHEGQRKGVARARDPRDEAERQALLKQRLEAQIERLERRLDEMKEELERIEKER